MENFLEYLAKGSLVIIAVVTVLVLAAPFALGLVVSTIIWRVVDEIHYRFFPPIEKPISRPSEGKPRWRAEFIKKELRREKERRELMRQIEENERQAAMKENEPKKKIEEEPLKLDKSFYLESKLKQGQREALLAKGYKRLKISPYGDSGASYYLINVRYNESKEHAFFCYLIESEMRKRVKNVILNVSRGPDVEFEYKRKRYCFEVETGTNLARSKDLVARKFIHDRKSHDFTYVFVTNKELKYRYARYARVVTRGTLRKTLEQMFTRR